MYLKKSKNNKTGRTYLYIADGYHDREKGYTKTVTVQSLGYLDVLEKQYDDPIAHFSEVVKQMNEEKKQQKLSVPMQISLNEKLELNRKSRLYKNTNNFIFLGRNKEGKYAKYREVKRKLKKKIYLYKQGKIDLSSVTSSLISYKYLCNRDLKINY